MENEYSKREIDLLIKGVKDHIDEKDSHQDEKLDKILTQTTKTNGRVSKLEGWRSILVGAWIVVSGFVIPLLIYISFIEKNQLKEQILENQEVINDLLIN